MQCGNRKRGSFQNGRNGGRGLSGQPVVMRIGVDATFENPKLPSGATGYMINLLRCLARMDHENEYFIFTSDASRHLFEFPQENFHFISCWASNERRGLRIAAQHLQIPRLVHKLGLDVFNEPANVAPLTLSCPLVLTIKTMHHIHFANEIGWSRALFRKSMVYTSAHKADCIIANSISNRDDIVRYLRVPSEKVVIIHEAVNKDQFRTDIPEEETSRRLRDKGVRKPFILNVSALWAYKNQLNVVQAYAKLVREKGIPHDLVFVGGSDDQPDYAAKVRASVRECGLEDRVHFVGYLPHSEIIHFYCSADAFVYPSLFETFGLTLLEAMACGVPIVCSNRGSLPEIVAGAGLLVNPESVCEIAAAIEGVLQDSSLRETLVQKGFRRLQDFSWEKTAEQTRDVYLRVAHARQNGSARAAS
jgi:glycosyltransferase involved in cell wall biosynthesis